VSDLGVFLDTTADKILVCLTLVAMTAAHLTPIWIPLVIIGREFLISGLRSFAAACGRVISAHIWGKGKTAVTMIAIFCVLTAADGSAGGALSHIAPRSAWTDVRSASQWLLGISAVLTIISGLRYVVDAWPLFRPIAPVSGRASDPELDERTPLAAGDA
jgi:CDP-diacylglycerol--glycerol-3-phosphate 3-phosphatidyltransferase